VRVTVSGDKVENLKFLDGPSNPSDFNDRRYYPRDVDALFQIIDDAYKSKAYKIEITFDEIFGYPAKAFIDRDRDTYDDEQWLELENFEAAISDNTPRGRPRDR